MENKIHLKGVGMLGSFLARRLDEEGIYFTCEDNDSHSAWKASTGSIHPANDERLMLGHNTWKEMGKNDRMGLRSYIEEADMWYNTKTHPFGLGEESVRSEGVLHTADVTTLTLNVTKFVLETRRALKDRMVEKPEGSLVINSHGFGKTVKTYTWGWSSLVRLSYPTTMTVTRRPSFVMFKNRYQRPYAYPVPSANYYLIGSSYIRQSTPRERDPKEGLAHWQQEVEDITKGAVRVEEVIDVLQGWRPVGDKVSPKKPIFADGEIHLPSLGPDGVRLAPIIADETIEIIRGVYP